MTILTQLPASAVANGAFGVAEYDEDRDVRHVPASLASVAAAAAEDVAVEENAEALAALQRECAEGVLAWEEASTVAGKMEQDDGINLEELEPPESEDDEDEVEDTSGSDAPDGSETSSALSEASKLPPSVVLARERIGKQVEAEPIGDNEISIAGANDSTSLEGMAYTLWHSPIGCFRVNRDLSITQANPKWRQTCGLQDGESNDSWPAMVHPDDREKVVKHYSKIAETLPLERDEYEFRWLPDGTRDRWCMCVIEPAVINGVMAGYSGFLIKFVLFFDRLLVTDARADHARFHLQHQQAQSSTNCHGAPRGAAPQRARPHVRDDFGRTRPDRPQGQDPHRQQGVVRRRPADRGSGSGTLGRSDAPRGL